MERASFGTEVRSYERADLLAIGGLRALHAIEEQSARSAYHASVGRGRRRASGREPRTDFAALAGGAIATMIECAHGEPPAAPSRDRWRPADLQGFMSPPVTRSCTRRDPDGTPGSRDGLGQNEGSARTGPDQQFLWSGRRDSNPRPPPWQLHGSRLIRLRRSQQWS